MPNPKKFHSQKKFMKSCMHQVKKAEGKPQKQAIAQCLNMWRSKSESCQSFIEHYFEKE